MLYKIIEREFKVNQAIKRVVLFYYLIKAKGLLYRTLKAELRILLYQKINLE